MSVGHFYDIPHYDGDTLTCLPLEYKEHSIKYQIIDNTSAKSKSTFYEVLEDYYPWVPGLLPPGRAERSQGAGWFRALRSGCADKLGSDSGWRNVAQGLPGQVRPPHTPRSWQGTGQSGHSAAGPDTSPVHPPRSSSAAPPLREGGLVTGSCPPHSWNWVKD